jgi:ubiquinol-cytochrome c reductase cytochrome b subunit
VTIFLLMMATAFMGYVLPWGQMSFWGAKVITGLFSAIPVVGAAATVAAGRLRAGQRRAQPLLQLHFLLPFVILGVVILHIWALHIPVRRTPRAWK